MKIHTPVLIFALTTLLAVGCTKKSDDGDSSNSPPPADGGGSIPSEAFATSCGTVSGGTLTNPASPSDGFRSAVTVIGPNKVSVTLPTGPLLVKLHGLDTPSSKFDAAAAMSALQTLATEEGVFIPADPDCPASVNSKDGALGQVFTISGKSYSETLINRGLAKIDSDPCGGDLLRSCYRALEDEVSTKIAGEVRELLWKPVSDSDGRLAVHTAPSGTTVIVNGETGTNQGGGNGYGSLARFTKPGCAYGGNVQVKVIDSKGAAYTFNGATTITIPNGCSRTCLEGTTIAQCSKS